MEVGDCLIHMLTEDSCQPFAGTGGGSEGAEIENGIFGEKTSPADLRQHGRLRPP